MLEIQIEKNNFSVYNNVIQSLIEAFNWGKEYLKINDEPILLITDEPLNYTGSYDSKKHLITVCINTPVASIRSNPIITLFHEMVHVKQFQKGWVKEKNDLFYWKKNKIIEGVTESYHIKDNVAYWNSPHEIQARDLSNSMFKKYVKKTC